MKPFKLPYRVAAAGGLSASAAGLGLALCYNSWRRSHGAPPLSKLWIAALALAAGAGFSALYFPPYAQRRSTAPLVHLTFDDGPDPATTPQILDALAAAGMTGTFFLLGQSAAQQPSLVERLVREGHTVGLHGFAHDAVTFQLPGAIRQDLRQSLDALQPSIGNYPVRLYRPPYGLRGPGLRPALRRLNLKMELWTLDSHDYLLRSSKPIRQRLLESLLPGDVVLLHDAGETGSATAEALPGILRDVAGRGWRSVGL